MTKTLVLRPAYTSEIESLADVGLRAWQKGTGPLVPKNVYQRICEDDPFLPFLKAMGEAVLVAEFNGKIGGFAACEDNDNHISDLWVDPEIEGQGIGSALIRKLEAAIASKGYRSSEIQVTAQNNCLWSLSASGLPDRMAGVLA